MRYLKPLFLKELARRSNPKQLGKVEVRTRLGKVRPKPAKGKVRTKEGIRLTGRKGRKQEGPMGDLLVGWGICFDVYNHSLETYSCRSINYPATLSLVQLPVLRL